MSGLLYPFCVIYYQAPSVRVKELNEEGIVLNEVKGESNEERIALNEVSECRLSTLT